MGPERKSRIISEKDRRVTAYHEGGHALVARAIPQADPVRKITILPRGQALGVTSLVPDQDRYNKTRSEMLASLAVFMGGRVAEEVVFGEITTGASNDIERATEIARDMVCRFGMSDTIGPVNYGHKQSQVFLGRDISEHRNYSENTSQAIDAEVRRILTESYERARNILQDHRQDLDKLTDLLMEKELVEAAELDELLGPSARDILKKEEQEREGVNLSKEDNSSTSNEVAESKLSSPEDTSEEKATKAEN